MRAVSLRTVAGISLTAALLGSCGPSEPVASGSEAVDAATAREALATYTDWPAIASAIPKDPTMESRIAQIVAGMTLAQKIGQMTQAKSQSITPAEVTQYSIGSVLNGGGSWPGNTPARS